MKLLKLNYLGGPYLNPLDGFNQPFHTTDDLDLPTPICLAGINGSGKSKLLEILTDIFFYLDSFYDSSRESNEKTRLRFEIEYIKETPRPIHVKISQLSDVGVPQTEIIERGKAKIIEKKAEVEKLLPKYIVGYTSGDNQTLSKRFEETYIEYSDAVTNLANNPDGHRVPDTRLIFLDNKVNSYVFIANSIFRSQRQLEPIQEKIKPLESLESFRITVQLAPRYKGRNIPIDLTPELNKYIACLKKCATSYYYEQDTDKTTLDFYVNADTKKLFKMYFSSAFDLYNSLYKLDLLNDILLRKDKKSIIRNAEYPNQKHIYPELSSEDKVFNIDNVRLNIKGAQDDIDYYDLSDGEHQLIHVLGSILMIDSPDTLFLLDEPETHFNPQWRAKFISTLNTIKSTAKQDFFITTHSPFLLGDCKREHVLIFENGKSHNPSIQTYGLSIERLLKEGFGVVPPMSEKSLIDITHLQKSRSSRMIESRLDDFGDSIEKFYLYDRLAQLKKSQK